VKQFTPFGPPGHFYECPRWHDGAWWVSDFFGHRVLRIDEMGLATTVAHVPSQPGGLGWLPDGSLLVVSMQDRRVLRLKGGVLSLHADLSPLCPGWANDLCVSSTGNAYVGNFGFDLTDRNAPTRRTNLVMVSPEGCAEVVADDLAFPNACVLNDDETLLIVNETFASRHTAFDVDSLGRLSNRRVWAQIGEPPADPDNARADLVYAPDGACSDGEGAIWVADAWAKRIVRINEGGEVLNEIRLPEGLSAFACCLGGASGSTLLVAACPLLGREELEATPHSQLLLLDVTALEPR
jgi:sugar lactone lactonase YvrE